MIFDYDDDEEDKKSEEEEPEREKTPPALMAKVQEFLAKAPSPPVSICFIYISCNVHEYSLSNLFETEIKNCMQTMHLG